MVRQVRCECGIVARATSDNEVVALVLAHLAAKHPDLATTPTAEDIRNWIELVPE